MPQVRASPRFESASSRIGRSDAALCFGEVDHALDLRGCLFLVGKGSYERAIANTAILGLRRKPSVPRARDALRRPPPRHELLSLPLRLRDPRVAVISGAAVVPSGLVSSRTEEHVRYTEPIVTPILLEVGSGARG